MNDPWMLMGVPELGRSHFMHLPAATPRLRVFLPPVPPPLRTPLHSPPPPPYLQPHLGLPAAWAAQLQNHTRPHACSASCPPAPPTLVHTCSSISVFPLPAGPHSSRTTPGLMLSALSTSATPAAMTDWVMMRRSRYNTNLWSIGSARKASGRISVEARS